MVKKVSLMNRKTNPKIHDAVAQEKKIFLELCNYRSLVIKQAK